MRRHAEAEFLMLQNPTAASLTCTARNPGTKQSPASMSVGSAETAAPKFRMQFRWMNIQYCLKTLQFQRSDFKV